MAAKTSNRSGVALIIVLGLVAILMIISVAFAIHMRVERAGAANLRHAAVARQIVKGGMAAAIAAIDKDVGDEVVAPWFDENNVESLIYNRTESWYNEGSMVERTTNFWKGTLVSYDVNSRVEHVPAHFPAEVDDYLPYGLKYRSFANKYGSYSIIQPEWLPVYSDVGNSSVVGRYAYFVLDTTGMLDANAQYGAETRNLGRHASEIQLMPSVVRIPTGNNGAYVNIAELEKVNSNLKNANFWWNTFSYEPTNDLIDIGGDAEDIKRRKKEIVEAFYDLGLTAGKKFGEKDCEQARWAYLGLVDYIDGDSKMEDDDNIKPYERPVTERMPLLSGFFGKLTIKARQQCEKDKDDPSFDDSAPVQVHISAKVKVPFVFPFIPESFTSADRQNLKLEGKAALVVNARGGSAVSDVKTKSISPTDPDDCVISSIELDEGDDGWINVRGKNQGGMSLADQLKLPEVEAKLRVAGATFRGSERQHSFPVKGDYYDDFDEEEMGMFVKFVPENEGVKFEDVPTPSSSAPDANGKVTKVRSWETNVLVWAEIVDPRFSNKAMVNNADVDEEIMLSCCKVSHGTLGSGNHGIPLSKIRKRLTAFSGFNAAEGVLAKPADTACGSWTGTDDYGKYFDGNIYYETMVGTSPFTSYLLTHPAAVEALYGMPMDGIQRGATPAETDKAWAQWRMFVRNEKLDSVGELGYLPIGFWQTIRLYDYGDQFGNPLTDKTVEEIYNFNKLPKDPQVRLFQDLHDSGNDDHESDDEHPIYFHNVLDCFTVVKANADGADETVRGRINLNASPKDILASAFYQMPVNKPDDFISGNAKISETSADLLATAIIESRNHRGNFCGLSELGYLFEEGYPDDAVKQAAGSATWGEWERESVIRNSYGLFTTRGQSFLIIVRGESYSPRFGRKRSMLGGNSNASKTAIAQIWRDTIPDANGKHPIFVKFFKIVDD